MAAREVAGNPGKERKDRRPGITPLFSEGRNAGHTPALSGPGPLTGSFLRRRPPHRLRTPERSRSRSPLRRSVLRRSLFPPKHSLYNEKEKGRGSHMVQKRSRVILEAAWQLIREADIRWLPVDPFLLLEGLGVRVIPADRVVKNEHLDPRWLRKERGALLLVHRKKQTFTIVYEEQRPPSGCAGSSCGNWDIFVSATCPLRREHRHSPATSGTRSILRRRCSPPCPFCGQPVPHSGKRSPICARSPRRWQRSGSST